MLRNPKQQAIIASLWQLPGFILGLSVIMGIERVTDLAYYFVFMLELWVTPILPLVSLLPHWTYYGEAYLLLFIIRNGADPGSILLPVLRIGPYPKIVNPLAPYCI